MVPPHTEPQHSRGRGIPGVVAEGGNTSPEPQHHKGRVILVVVAGVARRIDVVIFWPGTPFCVLDWVCR